MRLATLTSAAALALTAAILAWTGTAAAAETWRWPVTGAVVVAFADAGGAYAAGQHRGVDIEAAPGTPVVAAVGGTVRFSGLVGSSGITLSIRTADGRFDVSYLHLSAASVRAGQTLAAGDRLGAVGTSGRGSTAAPHLHIGVRDAGTRRYRDPLDFLPPAPRVRDAPRGAPVPALRPVRVGPAPQPIRPHRFPVRVGPAPEPLRPHRFPVRVAIASASGRPHRFPVAARRRGPAAAPSRAGWAIACGALILAAVLLGTRSSIGTRVVLRHHPDLLRQR